LAGQGRVKSMPGGTLPNPVISPGLFENDQHAPWCDARITGPEG
jgi:hypothetical protein